VIRDILHRIRERWPCRVLVWPVVVQGEQAARQVSEAIDGFGALEPGGAIPRPDLIIVARGGGSVEDLWPFNDEALVRAAAASTIPLISAVGHETDTTLIDFASDRRAPTPTAAAEMATPVFADLAGTIADYQRRLAQCGGRMIELRRVRLAAGAGGLPRPADLLAIATQRLDLASGRLGAALQHNIAAHRQDWLSIGAPFKPGLLFRPIQVKGERLATLSGRLPPAIGRRLERTADRLESLEKLRLSFNPDGPLKRGFARVHRGDGHLARSAAALAPGDEVRLVFWDGERSAAIHGPEATRPAKPKRPAKSGPGDGGQGALF
jgi:exodeoxyribonuclease VII large subunit